MECWDVITRVRINFIVQTTLWGRQNNGVTIFKKFKSKGMS